MNKNIIIRLSILAVVVFLGFISYSSSIDNPLVALKALIQISIGQEDVEKVSGEPLRYIGKSYEDFTKYMESKGCVVEQGGRGFIVEKDGEAKLFIAEGFMGIYEIFTLS